MPRPDMTTGTRPLQITERDDSEISIIVIIWMIPAGIEFSEI
jgi:hypothetical protein